jgi:hypothetical protein
MPNAQIDSYRLARAVHLDCDRMGYGHCYLIPSQDGERQYLVNLERDECPCPDSQMGNVCKHRLRAMLAEGDEAVVKRLRWFIPMPSARKRQVAKV